MYRVLSRYGVIALLGAAVAVVATAAPAHAGTPKCNTVELFPNLDGQYLDVPVYRSGSMATELCGIYEGDTGDDVNQLQWTLNYCYSESLKQDSVFGAKTKAALVRAQQREHIKADGSYGPQTALAIFHPHVPTGGCAKF